MNSADLLELLAADVARVREAASVDLSAEVPSCPGWTVADLLRHLAHGYVDVVVPQLRQGEPGLVGGDLSDADPVAVFEHGYGVMVEELAAYARHSGTDREVSAFWVRRMAHETAMHRIDADLAVRRTPTAMAVELALDGVDELLTTFLARETTQWTEQYADELGDWAGRWLMVSTGAAAWRVAVRPQGASVSSLDPGLLPPMAGCAARIESDPETFLRWAYNRPLAQAVAATGDKPMIEQFKRLLTAVTGVG